MKRILPLSLLLCISIIVFNACKKDETKSPASPPVAAFSYSGVIDVVPAVITFTNSSTDAESYVWNFGDGNTSTDKNPQHTYTVDGIYTVVLTAMGTGGTDTSSVELKIGDPSTATGTKLRWSVIPNNDYNLTFVYHSGKIYASPYRYSEDDCITWHDIANDGLNREFVRLSNNQIVESRPNGTARIYTSLNNSATLNVPKSPSQVSWDLSATAYAYYDNELYKTTNSGSTWAPVTFTKQSDFKEITSIAQNGSTLYAVQKFAEQPGGFIRYILMVSTNGGSTWIESSTKTVPITVKVINPTVVYVFLGDQSTSQGLHTLSVSGSTINLTALSFESGFTNSVRASIITHLPNNQLFIGSPAEGYYIPHPQSGKMYKPSALPIAIGSMAITDNAIFVSSGNKIYTTDFPFKFYETE